MIYLLVAVAVFILAWWFWPRPKCAICRQMAVVRFGSYHLCQHHYDAVRTA